LKELLAKAGQVRALLDPDSEAYEAFCDLHIGYTQGHRGSAQAQHRMALGGSRCPPPTRWFPYGRGRLC